MKKFNSFYLILFVFAFFIFLNEVKAKNTYEKEPSLDESNLLAKCVYESEDNQTMNVYIFKDYNIYADLDQYEGYYNKLTTHVNLEYSNYIEEETRDIKCDNVSELYTHSTTETRSDRLVYIHYYINLSKEIPVAGKWTINTEESEVYVKNNEQEDLKDNDWLGICHYGTYYLKFNKETYEANFVKTYNGKDYLEIIKENSYSCPASLCVEVTGASYQGQSYSTHFGTLYNEYKSDSNCYVAENFANEYRCGNLNLYFKNYVSAETAFNENGKIEHKKELDRARENISVFCNGVYQNLNYNDSNNCVKECFEIVDIIKEDFKSTTGKCGFSEKLILFIANIVKWIKYIVPVLVIVLGILDFIKAIASEKDDEMKKAQKRFATRLIAAALIFIAPFIIEFVLVKMGFDANGCGIIDL